MWRSIAEGTWDACEIIAAQSRILVLWAALLVVAQVFQTYRKDWGISDTTLLTIGLFALAFVIALVIENLEQRTGLQEFPTAKWVRKLREGKPIKPATKFPKASPLKAGALTTMPVLFSKTSGRWQSAPMNYFPKAKCRGGSRS